VKKKEKLQVKAKEGILL